MTVPPLPSVSLGAATLIAIMRENDRRHQVATNPALRFALEALQALPGLCRQPGRGLLEPALGVKELPRSFFLFCAAWTRRLDQQVRELERPPTNLWEATTSFDHAVHQAFGQTLLGLVEGGMAAWSDLPACLRAVARTDPLELQARLVAEYLGNLLQESFDAAEVRFRNPNLPEDTEPNLRARDARAIAAALFAPLRDGPGSPAPETVQRQLDGLLARVATLGV
jgi:hypothetical protein